MKIAVVGATGMAGSRIAAEAVRRGHTVSGFSRSGGSGERAPGGFASFTADATDPAAMARLAAQHDVIVLATRQAPGTKGDVASPVTTVLDAALASGRRVVVIGGAGPLRSPDSDRLVVDDPRFVPREWRSTAQASVDQFNACAAHPADWTYLSPPALLEPGERTGSYQRGGNRILVDANGMSQITADDLAVAVLDEIEDPQPGSRHFTVARLTP
ncbi:NAD(P)H-binding protein [Actinokineospora sp. PR83]|uniref:NAD(P)-dependent oxidoreductase n=1 Tax=Actinokineospora sp. PR83 TaxID=2884908 RepID=UPI001F34BE89|nr:NAD(P)H-binding protein [Actinokineospora sp. PR83]MCG8915883.1 NAD(P)H-binding protein [Actinokineospora sp. PR83]